MQLKNTAYRLQNRMRVGVGYFGGSITEGAGTTAANLYSWRALTTALLRDKYPACEIVEVNAAIGGTGSCLGVYRCDDDLLSHGQIDLAFVEFSVNDGNEPETSIRENMEGIFHKIRSANPYTDIVLIFTTTRSLYDNVRAGKPPSAYTTHRALAEHYGFFSIDIGAVLAARVQYLIDQGKDPLEAWKFYTADTVHPNEVGYRIYADEIERTLLPVLTGDGTYTPYELSTPTGGVMDAFLFDAHKLTDSTFKRCEDSLSGRYPHTVVGDVGDTLSYTFTGTDIGIYMGIYADSGMIAYSIDGGEWREKDTWDHYALRFNRACSDMLAKDLPYGEHTLKIRVLEKKNEQSKGNKVYLGALMTGACRGRKEK